MYGSPQETVSLWWRCSPKKSVAGWMEGWMMSFCRHKVQISVLLTVSKQMALTGQQACVPRLPRSQCQWPTDGDVHLVTGCILRNLPLPQIQLNHIKLLKGCGHWEGHYQ